MSTDRKMQRLRALEQPSITLYPKRLPAICMALLCGFGVAGSIWMIVEGESLGYLVACCCSLGFIVGILMLLPGSSHLRIDKSGFTVTALFRSGTTPWSIVEEFFIITAKHSGIKMSEMIGFNFVESYNGA